jgi:RHS repeat-associated protein
VTLATYEYDKLDRLLLLKNATGAISEEYGYDRRGNQAQVKVGGTVTRSYQWDGADRLIGTTIGSTSATLKYDVDGRRIQSKFVGSTVTETNYIWDTTTRYGDVLVETNPNSDFQARYIYGYACGSCNASPTAELVGQKRGTFNSFVTEYHLLDGQGSVRGLTDGTNGTLTQEYAYDTFGKLTSGDATKSAYLYTGQQYDAATELYSLRARYYSPQQGRFLSRDKWPVDYQNPMELNRYGYTANNPINWSDPSGYDRLFPFLTFIRTSVATPTAIKMVAQQIAIVHLTVFIVMALAYHLGNRYIHSCSPFGCKLVYSSEAANAAARGLRDMLIPLAGIVIPTVWVSGLNSGAITMGMVYALPLAVVGAGIAYTSNKLFDAVADAGPNGFVELNINFAPLWVEAKPTNLRPKY